MNVFRTLKNKFIVSSFHHLTFSTNSLIIFFMRKLGIKLVLSRFFPVNGEVLLILNQSSIAFLS